MKKGGGWELIIERLLWGAGCKLITTMEPPVRVFKSIGRGQFLAAFSKKGVLDFAGPLDGVHVEFDCKDIGANRFTFSVIKDHQIERLRALTEDCSLCGIALRMRGETANADRLYGVPGYVILNAIEAGDKSWSRQTLENLAEDGEIVRLQYEKPQFLLDFISLCANLKYILPDNYKWKKGESPWKYKRPPIG